MEADAKILNMQQHTRGGSVLRLCSFLQL